ncbi:MAG: CoA transferase [Candidatus Tectomicrobia bacterium]|uniref:CoA transferase n=1 Tax=Tectimicrobiota bacterium TaxID=2528274 RepID=A0A932CPJ7_UNCTE|nr:CoA transferase [Candidatus Tectomicrobia bacterium]
MKKEEFYKDALPHSAGPLEGVKILEATQNFAGPNVGTVLADLGAESIKVDQPGMGDALRHLPPFLNPDNEFESACQHLSINRNKRNITLSLKSPEGQELFRKLAAKVDVVVQNFKPGTMEKWGLGYEEIRQVRPDIIYVSVSGFGQFGPYHERPSYAPVGECMGGLAYVTGPAGGPPTRPGFGLGDSLAGWQGAIGALAALYHRKVTGQGQHVDVSQVDTILYASEGGISLAANLDFRWERMGSAHPMAAPCNLYPCQEGHVFIGIILDSHWARFCRLIGRDDLIKDSRTVNAKQRTMNRDFTDGAITAWTQQHTVQQVVDALVKAELVVAPVYNFHQIVQDEHIREREMVAEVEHPVAGKMKLYGTCPKFSLTPTRIRRPAPMSGEHNEEVYGELLDLDQEHLVNLHERGII